MTDAQLLSLKPGDIVRSTYNGRTSEPRTLIAVGEVIRCINERSGAYGHYARRIVWQFSENAEMSTSIQSDEYVRGSGYETHDAQGHRVSGWELV